MVKVSFEGIPHTEGDYKNFLVDLSRLYERKQKFTMLFDTRNLGMPPGHFRQGLIQWINANHANAQQYLERSSVLITDTFVRTFVSLVLKMARTASPVQTFGTLRECCVFLGWDKLIVELRKKKG